MTWRTACLLAGLGTLIGIAVAAVARAEAGNRRPILSARAVGRADRARSRVAGRAVCEPGRHHWRKHGGGLGPTGFLNRTAATDVMDSAPMALDSRTRKGEDYIAAMKLAGSCAYAGRDWVCDRVARILGARVLDAVHRLLQGRSQNP